MAKSSKKSSSKSTKRVARTVKRERHNFDGKDRIKFLVKENPFREGTTRAASFDRLMKCKTIGDLENNMAKALKSGINLRRILNRSIRNDLVKVI